jgi:hypothetical protein
MEAVVQEVLLTVAAIVAPVIAALIVVVLVRLAQRVGLEVSAERQAKMEKVFTDAILATEEWAARRIKAKLPVSSGEKLRRTLTAAMRHFPGMTEDEAKEWVDAILPKLALGATAALRALREAATNETR